MLIDKMPDQLKLDRGIRLISYIYLFKDGFKGHF